MGTGKQLLGGWVIVALACGIGYAQVAGGTQTGFDHAGAVAKQLEAVAEQAAKDFDFDAAAASAERVLAYTVAYAPKRQEQAFVDAAFAHRMYRHLAQTRRDDARELLPFLQQHDELARTVAFLVSEQEKPGDVYAALNTLRKAHGDKLAEYPALTAALCVVHDQPLVRHVNENKVTAPPIADLFDFYVKHERRMLFGLTSVPAELLVYTVDVTDSIEELEWAVNKYPGNQRVGSLFFTIEYDYDHLRKGTTKKVTAAGFSLPNILQHGGVCADQAYFAVEVGKAIGVPTAYCVAQSGEVGHAWVGFLQARGRQGMWNFDTGRYSAYQGIRGNVVDPQTRQSIPDSYVSVLAEMIGTKTGERRAAAAFTDASNYLATVAADGFKPEPIGDVAQTVKTLVPRNADADARLSLLEAGLRQTPGYNRAWFAMRDLAAGGGMSLSDKKKWAGLLQQMCGRSYPDFTMTILGPMIESIDDPREQLRLWDAALKLVSRRADLSAEVRIAQGETWESLDEPAKAGQCYEDVIKRYANDGPFVITALKKTQQMLEASGKADRVVKLYESTWRSIQPPQQMAGTFATQSNYYRVGMLYVDQLEAAGEADQAQKVRTQIQKRIGV